MPIEQNQPSDAVTLRIPKPSLSGNYTPILIGLLILASFLLGILTTKVQYLERATSSSQATVAGTQKQAGAVAGTQTNQPQQPPAKVEVDPGHLPVLGNKNAKVTVVEFSDFQCPFCRRLWKDTLTQLKKEYIDTGKIKFAYRHFPLSFHPAAKPSAQASECANQQGKFWEMHDKIFEEQEKQGQGTIQYTVDDLKKWARDLGLNVTKFNECLDSGKYAKDVSEDEAAGQKAGVQGTPATFVNGQLVSGAQPYSAFKTLIDGELAK